MGKDFFDDLYKSMDPFGSFDFNDDDHYDAFERAAIDEAYNSAKRGGYDSGFYDDEDDEEDEDSDEYFDDEKDSDEYFDDFYKTSDKFSRGFNTAPASTDYFQDDEEDYGDSDKASDDEEADDGSYVTNRRGITKQVHITFTVGDPERDEYVARNISGKTYRNEAVKERAAEAFGEIYDVTIKGEKADEYYNRAVFIRDNGGKIAADYCDYIWRFKITDAIEEAYGLPKEYTDCYESDDNIFVLFPQLREFNSELCLNVFLWAWKEFSPYKEYDEDAVADLLSAGLDYSHDEEDDEYQKKIYDLLAKDRKFAEELYLEADKALKSIAYLIMIACEEGDAEAARTFTEILLDNKIKKANTKAGILLTASYFMPKNKTAYNTYFNGVLPTLRKRNNAFLNKKADEIEKELRENAWKYGIDEDESEEEVDNEPVDDWRKTVYIPYGITLNPADFSTREEFTAACKAAQKAIADKKAEAERKELAEKLNDKTVYTLYGVFIDEEKRAYMYKSEAPLNIGDKVTVPFGRDNAEYTGSVVYKKETLSIGVPFSMKKIKYAKLKKE